MFLDDELIKMCQNTKIDTPEKVSQLHSEICTKCEDYYKSKISISSTEKKIKIILNRTFNLFDSFVRTAKESNDFQLKTLGKIFEEFTFKKAFLSNDEMKIIYMNL